MTFTPIFRPALVVNAVPLVAMTSGPPAEVKVLVLRQRPSCVRENLADVPLGTAENAGEDIRAIQQGHVGGKSRIRERSGRNLARVENRNALGIQRVARKISGVQFVQRLPRSIAGIL